MSRRCFVVLAGACIASSCFAQPVALVPVLLGNPGSKAPSMAAALKSQSQAFVPNMGQWDAQAQFLAKSPGANLWVTESGVVYDFYEARVQGSGDGVQGENSPIKKQESTISNRKGHVVRMEFVDGLPSPVSGTDRLEGNYNFFLGKEESRWASNVPRFAEAKSERVYDGISARWYFDQGAPRYDLIVEPGADPSKVAMRFEGADGVSTDGRTLKLQTSLGAVEHRGLFAYQKVGNRIQQVAASFAAQGDTVRIKLGSYDRSKPLVVDPLVWSTFLGGATFDVAFDVASDLAGNAVVVGYTDATDFPTSAGAYDQTSNGVFDAYVAKVSADGSTLQWGTYLGGSSVDLGYAVSLDTVGNVVVSGRAQSADFPTTAGAYDLTHAGGYDTFVAKLSADGSTLLWGTLLGGTSNEEAYSVAVDASGNVGVAGYTEGADFPTTPGAFDQTFSGNDGFVAKLSADGSTLLWGTYLGGTFSDLANSMAFDASGNVTVAGDTGSADFPTTAGAYDQTFSGGSRDAFVARLSADGTSLSWGSLLGGATNDYARSVALDSSGNAVVVGETWSSDFPTTAGAYDTTLAGISDAFVLKLSADGSTLQWGTFLGGAGNDMSRSVALDASGNAVVAGQTTGSFPTTVGAYDTTYNGGSLDACVAKLSANGSSLLYGTYLGGLDFEVSFSVALDMAGNAVVAGYTISPNLPTTAGAHDQTPNGSYDGFVAKFVLGPPLANNNSHGVNAGGSLNIAAPGVLGNDTGSPDTAVLTQAPAQAAAFSLNSDGSFSYTPNTGFTGSDTFKYKAQNALGDSNEATVTLNVRQVLTGMTINNTGVVGGANITGTVTVAAPAPVGGTTVYFEDTDAAILSESFTVVVPQGQTSVAYAVPTSAVTTMTTRKRLTSKLNNGSQVAQHVFLWVRIGLQAAPNSYGVNAGSALSPAAPGVLGNDVTVSGSTAVMSQAPAHAASFTLNADGSFSYTPAAGYAGIDTFKYRVAKGNELSNQTTVTITVRAVLSSLTANSLILTGGTPITGTVTLTTPAPTGGTVVYFSDGDDNILAEGYTVTIPAGQTSAPYSINTTAVAAVELNRRLTVGLNNGSGIGKSVFVRLNP